MTFSEESRAFEYGFEGKRVLRNRNNSCAQRADFPGAERRAAKTRCCRFLDRSSICRRFQQRAAPAGEHRIDSLRVPLGSEIVMIGVHFQESCCNCPLRAICVMKVKLGLGSSSGAARIQLKSKAPQPGGREHQSGAEA